MLGFGVLRAMNDSVKSNRELLKGSKKNFLEKDVHYALRTGKVVFKDKQASPETIALIRTSMLRNVKREIAKTLLILVLSVLVLFAIPFIIGFVFFPPWG